MQVLLFVCGRCVWVCVCVSGLVSACVVWIFMASLSLRLFLFFLLSITSSKNPYRPFGEFQSHFAYRGQDGGLDDGLGCGDKGAAGGGGRRRRAGSRGGWSYSENPHRLADQSVGKCQRDDNQQAEERRAKMQVSHWSGGEVMVVESRGEEKKKKNTS